MSNCAQCRVRELDSSDPRALRGLRTAVEEALTLKPWALKRVEISRPLRGSALRAGWSKAVLSPVLEAIRVPQKLGQATGGPRFTVLRR